MCLNFPNLRILVTGVPYANIKQMFQINALGDYHGPYASIDDMPDIENQCLKRIPISRFFLANNYNYFLLVVSDSKSRVFIMDSHKKCKRSVWAA